MRLLSLVISEYKTVEEPIRFADNFPVERARVSTNYIKKGLSVTLSRKNGNKVVGLDIWTRLGKSLYRGSLHACYSSVEVFTK